MAKPTLKVSRAEASEIKKLLTQNEDFKIGIRLYIVYLVALGYSSRKLSELHQVSFKQITNWVKRFENEGVEGLKDKKGRGRRSQLSNAQLQEIKETILTKHPGQCGFDAKKWTGPLLADWIRNKYAIDYQKAQVYNLLEKVGVAFEKDRGLIESQIKV